MSIVETIQERVSRMSEAEQLRMLEYANHRTHLTAALTEADVNEYEDLLKELLMKRFEHHKANPEQAISGEELRTKLSAKYGWNR